MFIYKITIGEKVYIGFDSNPEYKETRWKAHCKLSLNKPRHKLHIEMKENGIENCKYEILEKGFKRIIDLALREIYYIKKYDSYKNGLNSTLGGDGMGKHNLSMMSDNEIKILKEALGDHWRKYNKLRWDSLTPNQRKKETAHLHTKEVYKKKSETLKKFYSANPEVKQEKALAIKKWRRENPEEVKEINRKNGLIGSEKVSKKVVVELENGEIISFKSISEFQRITGVWFSTLLEKSKQGSYHKGYILKNTNE